MTKQHLFGLVWLFLFCVGSLPVFGQDDIEWIKLSDYFGKYYQYADEPRMTEALADDFRYFTNVPCPYVDCATGAGKKDYVAGVIEERKQGPFTVESINMIYIPGVTGVSQQESEKKVSFYCQLVTKAKGKRYKYYSVIDYYFRRSSGIWKISKIENRLIDR